MSLITIKSYPTVEARDSGTLNDTIGTMVATVANPLQFASTLRDVAYVKTPVAYFDNRTGRYLYLDEALISLGAISDENKNAWSYNGTVLSF